MARKKRTDTQDAGFGEGATAAQQERPRLTPVDIQQKVFRLAFRGYNERDVDEFLDHVTEDLAVLHEENKRLREQLLEGGGAPADAQGADRQAEAIVRQAREHAARLIQDAEQRGVAGVGSGLPTSFLLKERQFLQQLAALVQAHARRLKEEARRVRATEEETDREASEEVTTPEPAAPGVAASAAAAGMAESPGPQEATAPWSPVDPNEEPGAKEGSGERDPLASAWESGFSGQGGSEAHPEAPVTGPRRPRDEEEKEKEKEKEPSLRELFWGEE